MDITFTPAPKRQRVSANTSEQEAIIQGPHMQRTSPVTVQAGAGTGKTHTIGEIARAHPDRQILYLCFNKDIQLEAQAKFEDLPNMEPVTFHAFADRFSKVNSLSAERAYQDQWRKEVKTLVRSMLSKGDTPPKWKQLFGLFDEFAAQVLSLNAFLVAWWSANPTAQRSSLERWMRVLEAHVFSEQRTIRCLPWTVTFKAIQRASAFHPSPFSLDFAGKYDLVLVDEAQDLNCMFRQVAEHFIRTDRLVMFFGDKHQQINRWNGAENAMAHIQAHYTKTTTLTLSRSFRFGPAVASIANVLARTFHSHSTPLQGVARCETFVAMWDGERALSQTTGPTAFLAFRQQSVLDMALRCMARQKAFYLGNSTEKLLKEVRALYNKIANEPADQKGKILDEIRSRIQNEREVQPSESHVAKHPDDKDVYDALFKSRVTRRKRTAQTLALLTVHSSKGLEFDTLYVADDVFHPLDKPRKDVTTDEHSIAYTAVTRVKRALRLPPSAQSWVDESKL